ncbi:hypothetical protein Q4610_07560 [Sphingobium sp. HBC34]|uniref:SPOR domain-containing protein n=1 Tax=Sphingobium cyanobacteriorum TaxID=3063954 RepID=A0ABT8ZK42_9SPHN|nr:hypothetical protein [Sphingobium sp. HBC34]MDO7834902.1 hypothetical protein [Sphingobium sp. HBC34]
MGYDPVQSDYEHAPSAPIDERSRGSGVVFALVALALVLAIGFFYLTNDQRNDRPADAVTRAAGSIDDAAKVVGDAAHNAADRLRNTDK